MGKEQRVIRIVVADDSDETRQSLSKLLNLEDDVEVVGEARNGREAVEQVKALRPHIVLMDVRMPEMDGFGATEIIVADVPVTQVILMSVVGSAEFLRRAMLGGAREFLTKPFEPDEMLVAIRRVAETFCSFEDESPAEPQRAAVQEAPAPKNEGTVVAVFGPKGGVGRTTVACNLACALAAKKEKKVALVDACLRFGDVALTMGLRNERNLSDLAQVEPDEIDIKMIENAMVTHKAGIRALLAPQTPEQGDLITPPAVRNTVARLRAAYDFVVVDVSAAMHDTDLAVLDVADKIVMLFTLELTAVKDVKLFLDLTKALNYPKDKMLMVANRVEEQGGVKLADVEGSLRFTTGICIRNDPKLATLALNKGQPFVLSHGQSSLAQSIHELAGMLGPSTTPQTETKKSGRGGLFSSRGKQKTQAA